MIISPADPNCVKYWILVLLFFSTFDNVLLFCKKTSIFFGLNFHTVAHVLARINMST